MSTVGKAMFLLEQFSAAEPEHGLSELARKASFDKATTRRLLVSLAGHGIVEQDMESRRYRLGPGLSRLARVRESHFPFQQVCIPHIRELAQETGETIHLSEYSSGTLMTVHVELSTRANRVNVDVGQILPLHGTASGIAFLSRARGDILKACLEGRMVAYTPFTITKRANLEEAVDQARYPVEDRVSHARLPVPGARRKWRRACRRRGSGRDRAPGCDPPRAHGSAGG